MIGNLRNILAKSILKTIFHALVRSRINYLIVVWGRAADVHLHQIELFEKRYLKYIYGLPRLTSTVSVHSNCANDILPIKRLYRFDLCKLMNEEFRTITHRFETRGRSLFAAPVIRIEYGRRDFAYFGPLIYNDLPLQLKNILSASLSKKHLKNYFLIDDGFG